MGAFLLFLVILCFISGTVSVAIAISLTGEVKDMSFAEQIFKIFVPLIVIAGLCISGAIKALSLLRQIYY